jgi:hypothetical protein
VSGAEKRRALSRRLAAEAAGGVFLLGPAGRFTMSEQASGVPRETASAKH